MMDLHFNILNMIVKYWAGTITPAIIESTSVTAWGLVWLRRAQQAETQGKELVIFEVPKNEVTGCIEDTEASLELYLRLDNG
jgi:hypothetical protein